MSDFGKKIDIIRDVGESRGGGCTLLCSTLCQQRATSLCKCKNGKIANKGSTFYEKRNHQIAIHREPTTA